MQRVLKKVISTVFFSWCRQLQVLFLILFMKRVSKIQFFNHPKDEQFFTQIPKALGWFPGCFLQSWTRNFAKTFQLDRVPWIQNASLKVVGLYAHTNVYCFCKYCTTLYTCMTDLLWFASKIMYRWSYQ